MRFLANLWCFGLEDTIVSLSSNTRPTSGSQKWGMSIETNETLVPFESNHKIGLWSGLHQWAIISGKKTFDCSACDVQKWHCRVTFLSCMKWSLIYWTALNHCMGNYHHHPHYSFPLHWRNFNVKAAKLLKRKLLFFSSWVLLKSLNWK